MKRAINKCARILAVVIMILGLFSLSSSAFIQHPYSFPFEQKLTDNMRYSNLYLRDTGSAYVYPNNSSVATMYFMSPHDYGYLQATSIVNLSAHSPGYFSWYSGYGGSNQWYCLAGCPDNSWWPWSPYTIGGYFYE